MEADPDEPAVLQAVDQVRCGRCDTTGTSLTLSMTHTHMHTQILERLSVMFSLDIAKRVTFVKVLCVLQSVRPLHGITWSMLSAAAVCMGLTVPFSVPGPFHCRVGRGCGARRQLCGTCDVAAAQISPGRGRRAVTCVTNSVRSPQAQNTFTAVMSVVASMIGYIGSHRHDRGAIFLYFVLELWGLSTVTTYLISVRSRLVVPALVSGPCMITALTLWYTLCTDRQGVKTERANALTCNEIVLTDK